MHTLLKEWSHALLDLVYPPHCLSCQRAIDDVRAYMCSLCWAEVATSCAVEKRHSLDDFSRSQKKEMAGGRIKPAFCDRLVVWAEFAGAMQQAIHALKFRRQRSLGRELGRRMGLTYAGELRGIEGLVPVPLHPARQRERGYNQSLEIARGLAVVLKVPVLEGFVHRRAYTRQQAFLGAEERRENVSNAFVVKQPMGRLGKLAIVDDVMTTGATLAACAGVLAAADVGQVWALVLARATIGRS